MLTGLFASHHAQLTKAMLKWSQDLAEVLLA